MTALKLLLLLFLVAKTLSEPGDIVQFPIAGLFNNNIRSNSRQVFEKIGVTNTSNYYGRIIYPSVLDPYSTSLEVCKNTSNGVVALIDGRPTSGYCDNTCLLCNKLNIVHLSLGWEPTDTMADDPYTFSYAPPPNEISKAFANAIKMLNWEKFTIFYEDDSSFVRLQEVIGTWPHNKYPITYRKLLPKGENRETFKNVIKVELLTNHILDCDVENVPQYFREIMAVENSTQYQSFLLTNLDTIMMKLDSLNKLSETAPWAGNVSTFYIMTATPSQWADIDIYPDVLDVRTEMAYEVDAVNHLLRAIKKMLNDAELSPKEYDPIPPLCFHSSKEDYVPWEYGEKLREALASTQLASGFTGNVQFDSSGQRKNYVLQYAELEYNSVDQQYIFNNKGFWSSETEAFSSEASKEERITTKQSGPIRVVSRIGRPYFDRNPEGGFKGYAVDLVTAIFETINSLQKKETFEVTFHKVKDDAYGSPLEGSKKWNGIIGELMEHEADLGICDLSITSERNKVVDFSTPFMTTGISMLFREKDPVDPDMFSFIKPLALDVWLYLATAYIIVSYIILVCARMSQDDWVNPHPCNQNPEKLQNIWSLYNCMWLTMGSIMTQGCDILPRGLGSRWVAGIWYFFAMIVTASYTANMSTFLSSSRRSNDIADAKQLSEQTKVTYGAVVNASTYFFFKNSNDSVYQKLWQVMESTKPSVFTTSNEEGKDRVLNSKGNYAFFMESTAIRFYTERNPKLKMVGAPLDTKAYGIAMPKNFQHKWLVDKAILTLQENGKLVSLASKWWKEEWNEKNETEAAVEEDDSGSLQMKNTAGIFMVLGSGGVLGLIVAIIDFMLYAQKIAVKEKVTFKEALASEWRASFNPRRLSKPAAPPRSEPPSTKSSSPNHGRSRSRAVSVLKAATSFINFDEIY